MSDMPEVEDVVARFEDALINGENPKIELWLDLAAENQIEVLTELIGAEIEYLVKKKQSDVQAEDYIARFPGLKNDPENIRNLIQYELLIRASVGEDIDERDLHRRLANFDDGNVKNNSLFLRAFQQKRNLANAASAVSKLEQSVEERFKIDRLIATGGAGKVWLGKDQQLDRPVAIKELKDVHSDDRQMQQRFEREALITGKLEHPGIVPIYGFGKLDGRAVYAMRFVEGKSMADEIASLHGNQEKSSDRSGRALKFRRILGQFIDLCNTIQYAHSMGIVHRDVKPQNVMIGKYGETLVVDWGLAKDQNSPNALPKYPKNSAGRRKENDTGNGNENHTQQGDIVGTFGYMSPEQSQGQNEQVDARSDIYSLGVTLRSIVTGKSPDEKSNLLPAKHRPLGAIFDKAMQESRQRRFESAKELADEVERYLADEPVLSYADSYAERIARYVRRNQRTVVVASLALLALIGASSFGLMQYQKWKLSEIANKRYEDANNALSRLAHDKNIPQDVLSKYMTNTNMHLSSTAKSAYALKFERQANSCMERKDWQEEMRLVNESLPYSKSAFDGFQDQENSHFATSTAYRVGRSYSRLAAFHNHMENPELALESSEAAIEWIRRGIEIEESNYPPDFDVEPGIDWMLLKKRHLYILLERATAQKKLGNMEQSNREIGEALEIGRSALQRARKHAELTQIDAYQGLLQRLQKAVEKVEGF